MTRYQAEKALLVIIPGSWVKQKIQEAGGLRVTAYAPGGDKWVVEDGTSPSRAWDRLVEKVRVARAVEGRGRDPLPRG
jgi:hypothetical protein